MRKLIASVAFAVAAAWSTLSAPASAQTAKGFGESGQVILGVDRLVPIISYESVKTTNNNGQPTTLSVTGISLVGHGHTISVYNNPRLAFDYTVTRHLTLGGSLYAYFQVGNSLTYPDGAGRTVTQEGAKETLWGIAPRIGYIIPLSDSVAFWPRGGFSFNDINHGSVQVNGNTYAASNATLFALDLEPTFVFTPFPHVGITLGGAVDIPLTGSTDVPTGINNLSVSYDLAEWHVGAHVGLLVYF